MRTAIAYYSQHHENTKRLIDAIAEADSDIMVIDVTKKHEVDLSDYDRIGFASGIYYSKFAQPILNFASVNLLREKEVFYIATCGSPRKNYFDSIGNIAKKRACKEIGRYLCKGFDTFGPFKMVGGIAKGHPTDEEIKEAVEFYKSL